MKTKEYKKIVIIIGTRAETIKMLPVIKEFKKRNIKVRIIGTGQHNLDNYYKPNFYLTIPPNKSSRFGFSKFKALKWSLSVIIKIFKNVKKGNLVLVHGDTLSSALISIGAKLRKCKIIHIEAGLRSFCNSEPKPEEIMRKIVDKLSNICFCPTHVAMDNLKNNKSKNYMVGNTIFDTLPNKNENLKVKDYAIACIHRQENLRSELRMRMILNILNNCNLKVYVYAYDNFLESIEKFGIKFNKNLIIKKPINHNKFLEKLRECCLIFSDGGSIFEEAKYFDKKIIDLRAYSERVNVITDKGASKKIVDILKNEL